MKKIKSTDIVLLSYSGGIDSLGTFLYLYQEYNVIPIITWTTFENNKPVQIIENFYRNEQLDILNKSLDIEIPIEQGLEFKSIKSNGGNYNGCFQPWVWITSLSQTICNIDKYLKDKPEDTNVYIATGYTKKDFQDNYCKLIRITPLMKNIVDNTVTMLNQELPCPELIFPVKNLSKKEVYKRILDFDKKYNTNLANTIWYCEFPDIETGKELRYVPCGECNKCKEFNTMINS